MGRKPVLQFGETRVLPIHVPQEQFLFAFRQCFDIGHQVAVVVEVEQDLAALAEVLDLAWLQRIVNGAGRGACGRRA